MNFITGHSFKNMANYVLDEFGFRSNKESFIDMPIYFVKTDYIHTFFNSSLLPKTTFNLITHNSDHNINHNHSKYLEYIFLNKWFAQNVDYIHSKLIPIPIGIANEEWPHGDTKTLQLVIDKSYEKKQLMYANFNLSTNTKQRKYCLKHIKPEFIENNVSFETYLKHTAESYFSICPLGNGIDSHRIWESLYLKTIPIAENTLNASLLKDKHRLPIILIDDWLDIENLYCNLNHSLYMKYMSSFDINSLDINRMIK